MGFFGDLTFTGPFPGATLLKVGGVALAALVVLYILKLRLRAVEIPFSKLWSRALKDTQSSSFWRRLKRLLSFLIQVLIVVLLLTAVGDPRSKAEVDEGRYFLVLVDASASMQAVDGEVTGQGKGPFTRLEEAKEKLKKLLAGKRRRDKVMIVRMDSQVTPLNTWETDLSVLRRVVDRIHASDAPADMARALRFAVDTLSPVKDPHLVIVGDGGYDPESLLTVYWGKHPPSDLLDQEPFEPFVSSETLSDDGGDEDDERDGPEDEDAEKEEDKSLGDQEGVDEKQSDPVDKAQRMKKDKRKKTGEDEEEGKKKKAPRPPALGGGAYLDPIGMGDIEVSSLLVGRSRNNVGITAFNARRYLDDKLNYEVFAQIRNYRDTNVTVAVELYSGGQIPDTSILNLGPGEVRTYIKRDLPASGADLTMKLVSRDGSRKRLDDFPLDDVAYGLIPERASLEILLVSNGNLFLEGALLLDEQSSYDRIPHEEYTPEMTNKYDVVIFDGYRGEELPPGGNYLIFDPDPEKSPIQVERQVKNPPMFWPSQPRHKRHAIMQFVNINNVNTVISSVLNLEKDDEPLMMTDERGPVFAAVRRRKGRRIVVVGFSLHQTDWVVRVSFPIFILDVLGWFAGDDPRLIPTYKTGETWRIPVDVAENAIQAIGPRRERIHVPVQDGEALLYGRHVGYYTLYPGKQRFRVAANLADVRESDIRVPDSLWLGGQKYGRKVPAADLERGPREEVEKHPARTWALVLLLLAVGLGLVVAGLFAGASGPVWVFIGLVLLSTTAAALIYLQGMQLWTALLVGVMVVLVAEWLTYHRRVTT